MRNSLVQLEFTTLSAARQATLENAAPLLRRSPDALYLHVPFCFHKCHYCDFYSLVEPADRDRQDVFTDALIGELRHRHDQAPLRPQTVFVGGGTPTLLRAPLWARLLDALHELGVLDCAIEFTVEANPETVTPELLSILRTGGVNRISMGAQSFQPTLLKALERWHEPANVARAVDAARSAGINNINLDMIFAIPGQTLELLDADLDAVLALRPEHVSYYGLTYEPNTALTMRRRLGKVAAVPEEIEAWMYTRVLDRLEVAGFEHYEVSNWARRDAAPCKAKTPRLACRHNLAYWHNKDWLGVGPAAASHADGWRWKNQPHLAHYLAGAPRPPVMDVEHLDAAGRTGEELMLRLRMRKGVEDAWLNAHLAKDEARRSMLDELIGLGLLERAGPQLRLTRHGLFVADAVIARLL